MTEQNGGHEQNMEEGRRVHDKADELRNSINESAMRYASETIKLLLVMNGGAVIAILSFIGVLVSKDKLPANQLAGVSNSLLWFATGIVATAFASGGSYLTNSFYASHLNAMNRTYLFPYLIETPASLWWRLAGIKLHFASIALAVISVILFVAGVVNVFLAISVLK